MPIEDIKRKVMRNLRTLEKEGMVSLRNDYQEIINAIARVNTCRYNCYQGIVCSVLASYGGLFPLFV